MVVVTGPTQVPLVVETSLSKSDYDGILLVASPDQKIPGELFGIISRQRKFDAAVEKEVTVIPLPDLPAGRVVYSPTGPLDQDYDDVRSFKDAAGKGTKRLIQAGIKRPLVVLLDYPKFEKTQLVTLLGVLEALYAHIQLRELAPDLSKKIDLVGVYTQNESETNNLVKLAQALDYGLSVAKDISEGDPERMAAPRVEEYVTAIFKDSNIKLNVVKGQDTFEKDYPLFAAVNRAASTVERHGGRIIFLEYNPADSSNIQKTLFLVGKGVTYDTGGADIKAGGVMAGMSRDKCGAASVAGFFAVLKLLKPENIRVVGGLCMVRNSIGSNCYVSDELIVTRAGVRVRIGNTDAEGRLCMTDTLCRMKELALETINPHLFTIATLTGHAVLAVGEKYAIAMDNGPARSENISKTLQVAGEKIADPIEISTLRREDFHFNKEKSEVAELLSCNNLPSSRTRRGHQVAPAFMLVASGLDQYGSGSSKPLKYTHLDMAGQAGLFPEPPTGTPILALANAFFLK